MCVKVVDSFPGLYPDDYHPPHYSDFSDDDAAAAAAGDDAAGQSGTQAAHDDASTAFVDTTAADLDAFSALNTYQVWKHSNSVCYVVNFSLFF